MTYYRRELPPEMLELTRHGGKVRKGGWRSGDGESGEQFIRVTCLPSCPEEGTFAMGNVRLLAELGLLLSSAILCSSASTSSVLLPSNTLQSRP